jgi:hypothetical protein
MEGRHRLKHISVTVNTNPRALTDSGMYAMVLLSGVLIRL